MISSKIIYMACCWLNLLKHSPFKNNSPRSPYTIKPVSEQTHNPIRNKSEQKKKKKAQPQFCKIFTSETVAINTVLCKRRQFLIELGWINIC